jgi:membrane fusion protein, multidrug efflux system
MINAISSPVARQAAVRQGANPLPPEECRRVWRCHELDRARNRVAVIALISAVFLLPGCGDESSLTPTSKAPAVVVVKAERATVPIVITTPGMTRSLRDVVIRARVTGFLKEQHFQEGADVHAGDLLVVIDEEPFQLELAHAQAELAQVEAQRERARESKTHEIAAAQLRLHQAQLDLTVIEERRQSQALARGNATRSEFDQAEAARKKAAAQVEADQAQEQQTASDYKTGILSSEAAVQKATAALHLAEANLAHCRIVAPVSGRIGEMRVKLGNLVSADDKTELVTIQQLDPMGVEIRVPARHLQEVTELARRGLSLRLILPGDRLYGEQAQVIFVDNTIDEATSTVLVKAQVANPQEVILPGELVQTSATIGQYQDAVVFPEQAVLRGPSGASVYVVDQQSHIVALPVKPVDTYQGLSVITAGFEADQSVVVEGTELVQPGMSVIMTERSIKVPTAAPVETTAVH